ncbi:MAG: DUF6062 family protein [Candidatus Brachytrichaceae bacterium NZ_4S206]
MEGMPLAYYSLIETMAQPGCAICNLLLRDADRFLDFMLYERVNEAETQQGVRRRFGFCNKHAWQLLQYRGNALGVAILFRSALGEALRVIEHTEPHASQRDLAHLFGFGRDAAGRAMSRLLDAIEPCMVCQTQAEAEARYLHALVAFVHDAQFHSALLASDGLCLPHFRMALRDAEDATAERLIQIQVNKWRALQSDLQTFIDKNDYRRMNEPMGTERDSYVRAIRSLCGEEGVFGVDARSPSA